MLHEMKCKTNWIMSFCTLSGLRYCGEFSDVENNFTLFYSVDANLFPKMHFAEIYYL